MGQETRESGRVEGDAEAVSADDQRLLEFVQARDVPCPRCGYNLRDLAEAKCPECAERLELRVGAATPRFGWLVAAMAPGLFSGVCAVLLAFPLWRFAGSTGGPPAAMYVAEAFGVVSVGAAVLMYASRRRLLALRVSRQARLAAAVWLAHVAAFALLVWAMTL